MKIPIKTALLYAYQDAVRLEIPFIEEYRKNPNGKNDLQMHKVNTFFKSLIFWEKSKYRERF